MVERIKKWWRVHIEGECPNCDRKLKSVQEQQGVALWGHDSCECGYKKLWCSPHYYDER